MRIFFVAFLTLAAGTCHAQVCGPKNIVCHTYSTYQFCFNVSGKVVLSGDIYSCENGKICDETEGNYACIEGIKTTVIPDTCTSAVKFPAQNCSAYYECVPFLWWFNLETKYCASGEGFDSETLTCVADSSCNAPTTTPIITTTSAPVTCTSAGKFPTQNCSEYYECVPFLWWFNLEKKSCASGEAFDDGTLTCVADASCNAPTTTPITTTTIAPVTPPAECKNASKYPAQNCSQYYECVPFLWWFNLELQTCASGSAFDSDKLECVEDSSCNSETTTTTTTSTTTTTTTTTIAPVTPPANCTSASKYPAENCNQYYECVPFLWWFNLELKSCSSGEAFVSETSQCVLDTTCNSETTTTFTQTTTTPATTTTTTTTTTEGTTKAPVTPPAACTSASKYPAENCYQYYECVPFLWWFNLELKSCSSGEAFSTETLECVADSSCNSETTTSTSTPTESTTTTVVTTTLTTTTTEPTTTLAPVLDTCTSSGKYPASNCNQYYECVPFLWWFKKELKSCSSGESFSSQTLKCVTDSTCNQAPTTCTRSGKYPAENCEQYYECIQFLWWYKLKLQTCSSGTTFNVEKLECDSNNSCNTKTSTISTTTTSLATTTPTTVTTLEITTKSPVTPPSNCTSASKYPAENCNQYYECVPILWWFNLEIKSCSSGEAFDSVALECVADSSCIAEVTTTTAVTSTTTYPTSTSTTTTTTASTTSTTTTTTPPTSTTSTTTIEVTAPSACTSANKYPTEKCNQYYECVPVLWWFNLELKSCSSGEAFNRTTLECIVDSSCVVEDTTTTTTLASTTTTTPTTSITTTTLSTTTPTTTTTSSTTTTPTTTTTPSTTTITTTTNEVTAPVACTSASKYPAENCNQYYECVPVLWWFNLELKSCPSGEALNRTTLECVADSSCVVEDTTTTTTLSSTTTTPTTSITTTTYPTTTPTTTTTSSTTTTPTTTTTPSTTTITTTTNEVTAPVACTSASKYPAENCNQYYECVPVLWWFNLELKSCPSGEALNRTTLECVADSSCVVEDTTTTTTLSSTITTPTTSITTTTYPTTTTPTTTTTSSTTTTPTTTTTPSTTTITTTTNEVTAPAACTTAEKYPSANCNQYYECVPNMWWFDLVTVTCAAGQSYNSTSKTCVTDSTCI